MKALSVVFSFLALLLGFSASAQVAVSLSLDQKQFLPGESVPVTVHITNRSGQMLHLGDAGWLTFYLQMDDGSIVARKSDPPVKEEFALDTDEVALKTVDLAPYFALAQSGGYQVSATVHIKQWNMDITSPPRHFDVIEGAQIWSQTFGVPDLATPNQPPNVRKYTLVEANYLQNQLRLYLQLDNVTTGSIIKVRSLCPMISFSQPEAQLDRASDLHVLCQSGATAFTYSVVNPEGTMVQKAIYDYVTSRPRLAQDAQGNIIVMGGIKRLQPDQLPAIKAPDELQ